MNEIKLIYRPKDHDDSVGWGAILRFKDESLQSRIELFPGIPILSFIGSSVGLFRDKGKSRHDDAVLEKRRLR